MSKNQRSPRRSDEHTDFRHFGRTFQRLTDFLRGSSVRVKAMEIAVTCGLTSANEYLLRVLREQAAEGSGSQVARISGVLVRFADMLGEYPRVVWPPEASSEGSKEKPMCVESLEDATTRLTVEFCDRGRYADARDLVDEVEATRRVAPQVLRELRSLVLRHRTEAQRAAEAAQPEEQAA